MSEKDNFYNVLKDNPRAIIRWAKSEIKEYQKLIKLIEKQIKKDAERR